MFPPKGPEDQGLFEPPAPGPQAPMRPEPTKINRAMALVALGLGLKNPAAGSGWAEGLLRHQQSTDRSNEARYRSDLDAFQIQQQQEQRQQQQAAQRMKLLSDAAATLREQKFSTKDDYDRAVDGFGSVLQQYGLRPGGQHVLRTMAPYRAPDATAKVHAALDKYFSNPLNKAAVESGEAMNGAIHVDVDGDGKIDLDRPIPVLQAVKEFGYPLFLTEDGRPKPMPKDVKDPSEFNRAWQIQVEIFKSEHNGEPPKPGAQERAVYEKAQQMAQKPSDPVLGEIRALRLEQLKNGGDGKPMTRYQKFQAEQAMRNDVEKYTMPVREMTRQVGIMRAGLEQAERTGSRTVGVQAVISPFNRILEPGSVTREAEYARTSQGQSMLDNLRGKIESMTAGGQGVRIETLREAVELAEQIAEDMASYADEPLNSIREQAMDFKLPADRLVPKPESYRLPKRAKAAPGKVVPPAVQKILERK